MSAALSVPSRFQNSKMKKYLSILYLLPVLLVALGSTKAEAQDFVVVGDEDVTDAKITYITLQWNRNSEPDIAGYNVYYSRVSGDYTHLEAVIDPTAIIGVRGSKTYYFAVTAYNTNGLESALSVEVHWP